MRILLVSYYFPPFNSVGSVRPGKLARFLEAQGHDVHVLTCANQPFPEGLPVEVAAERITAVDAWSINAPVEWLRGGRDKVAREGFGASAGAPSVTGRLGRLYKTLLHWPDAQLGWVGAAVQAGRGLVARQRFDVVYASAPPFSGLRVAAALARASRVPWVAELRDLWTANHSYDYPGWRRAIERRWEASLLSQAAALVTVSAPLVEQMRGFGKPVWEVRNGCDPEDFEGLARPEGFGADPRSLDIVFTGNVYDGHYDVEAFCAGLARFLGNGGRATVHVAGRNLAALKAAAQQHGIAQAFVFQGTVPRPQALAMQRHADVLLAFLWKGAAGEGVYSAKLFEYAGAGRPVLAVGARNGIGDLVESAGLGSQCADASTVADALWQWAQRKRAGAPMHAQLLPGHDFSRRAQFEQLESRLLTLVKG